MRVFKPSKKSSPVRSFSLSVTSGSQEISVAYGPGSVINGRIFLHLEKPVLTRHIKTVFQCIFRNKKRANWVFSVDSIVWGQEHETQTLPDGSHMYLFAIKLPHVNYPPSMTGLYFGHCVDYVLQAHLILDAKDTLVKTVPVSIKYLPLVALPDEKDTLQPVTKQALHGESAVSVSAALLHSAYCPGDMCTVELTADNKASAKITRVDLAFLSRVTSLTHESTESLDMGASHKHCFYSKTFSVAIAPYSEASKVALSFPIPDHCIPTIRSATIHLAVAYEIVLTVHIPYTATRSWPLHLPASLMTTPLLVTLPVAIATVPTARQVSQPVEMPLCTFSETPELPTFFPTIESPIPSPTSPFSTDGSWRARSPSFLSLSPSEGRRVSANQKDPTGHLMPPADASMSPRRDSDNTLTSDSHQ